MSFPTANVLKLKDTKRTRVRLDRNVAPCSRPTTPVIDPLHECKKVCPCTKERKKRGRRGKREKEEEKERKRNSKDRCQEADGKKGSPTKQKDIEELKQDLPT